MAAVLLLPTVKCKSRGLTGSEPCPAGPGLELGSELNLCACSLRSSCLSVSWARINFPKVCKKMGLLNDYLMPQSIVPFFGKCHI